ncbi:MAG: alpha/beta hydrolase [Pseudomonadota bacterium]
MRSDEEIIKLAYEMAIGPERYAELFYSLSDKLETTLTPNDQRSNEDIGNAIKSELDPLESHFENALSLMHSQGQKRDTARGSVRVVDTDTKPSLLLEPDGRIRFANEAARDLFGVENNKLLKDDQLDIGQLRELKTALGQLQQSQCGHVIAIFDMREADTDNFIKMALTHEYGPEREAVGLLKAVHISWYPKIAKRFRELFKLSKTELIIMRAVVDAVPISDLASSRGRSVGTVRQQLKRLLAKLNVRSQAELVSFYSGFTKFSLESVLEEGAYQENEIGRSQHVLPRPNGRIIDYECVGPEGGKPVVFLPGLLGGNTVTPKMNDELHAKNIRLIMPWRPGMSQSGLDGPPDFDSFKRHSADIEALMDRHEIECCPIIGHITGSIFAFAAAHYLPERVQKLVIVNGVFPTARGAHTKALDRSERMRLMVIRNAPSVGRMIVHAMLSKVDAGYDEEFLTIFLENDIDKTTTQSPFLREKFRKAFLERRFKAMTLSQTNSSNPHSTGNHFAKTLPARLNGTLGNRTRSTHLI